MHATRPSADIDALLANYSTSAGNSATKKGMAMALV